MKRSSLFLAPLLAALVAPPAAAQTIDQVLYENNQLTIELNAEDCTSGPGGAPRDLEFDYIVNFTTLGGLILRAHVHPNNGLPANQQDGCTTPSQDDFDYTAFVDRDLSANQQVTAVLNVEDIVGSACSEPARNTAGSLCFHLVDTFNGSAVQDSLGFNLDYDTVVPVKPSLGWTPGDGEVTLQLTGIGEGRDEAGEGYTYFVQYRPCVVAATDGGTSIPAADGGQAGVSVADSSTACEGSTPGDYIDFEVSSSNLSEGDDKSSATVTLGGLDNGVEYEARVYIVDDLGNTSPVSESIVVSPANQLSPLSIYGGDGSPFSGQPPNCAEAFGMSAPWFLALALVAGSWLRRRRRRLPGAAALAVLVVPAALSFAAPASADLGQVTMDLRVSPWVPNVDAGAGTTAYFPDGDGGLREGGLYECFFDGAFFDDSEIIPEIGFGGDVHLIDFFGSLQLGMGLGFSQVSGNTRALTDLGSDGRFQCGAAQDGKVELTLVKFRPGLTYRFDPLLDLWDIPLVPYGRFGLVGTTYVWTRDGSFDDKAQSGVNPVGVVFGWDASLGMMLALDFWDYVDPFATRTTKRARAMGTFNHAFLFTELQVSQLDNFGRPNDWVFTPRDDLLGTGLPFQLHFGLAVEFL